MDFRQLWRSCEFLWENKPGAVLLLLLGFCVFVYLVVDAWRHKKSRRRKPHSHH